MPAVGVRASSLQPIPPNTVEQLPDPGTTLAIPADGQVNGYGFTASVLGVAVGTTLPTGGVKAAAGQRLWVFGLRWSADVTYPQDASPEVTQVAATLIVAGNRLQIPAAQPQAPASGQSSSQIDSGAQYFAASIPADRGDVVVELASSGFAQDFSLTHMAPEGPRPTALYPAPAEWETANQLNLEHDIPTPFADAYFSDPDAELVVKVGQVTLSYFAPDGASDTAPSLTQAWLVPALTDGSIIPSRPGDYLQYEANVTAADMTVTLPDGTVTHPETFAGGPDPTGDLSFGSSSALFPWQYAFPVPAGTTQAKLTINLPAEPTVAAYQAGDPGETFHPSPIAFTLTLPAPKAAIPPPGAASTPAAIQPLAADGAATHISGNGGPGPPGVLIGVLAAIAVVIVSGFVLVRRRAAVAEADLDGLAGSPPPSDIGVPATDGSDQPSQRATESEGPQQVRSLAVPVAGVGPNGSVGDGAADSGQGSGEGEEFVPPEPPLLVGLVVLVMGRIEASGVAIPPGRGPLIPMVVFLAAKHRRPVSLLEIRQAMSVDNKNSQTTDDINGDGQLLSNRTVRSNLSRLRRILAPGQLPESSGEGYQLKDVTLDWDVFQQLTAEGEAAERRRDDPAAIEGYSKALALVRGTPYETDRGYGWVDKADLRSPIETATNKTARRLVRLALVAGKPRLAVWAAGQALLANPADESLATVAIDAAATTGSTATSRQAWT